MQETFHRFIDCVAKREYEKVWPLMSDAAKRQKIAQLRDQQEGVRATLVQHPGNRALYENLERRQFGIDVATFLAMSPRRLWFKSLEAARQRILEFRIQGKPIFTGDRARLPVGTRGSRPHYIYFVRGDSGWLLGPVPTHNEYFGPF